MSLFCAHAIGQINTGSIKPDVPMLLIGMENI